MLFDGKENDNYKFYAYLPLIRTTDNSKQNLSPCGFRIYEIRL